MPDETLFIERADKVATITLNRPERHNAFDDHLIARLTDVLIEVEADTAVRVVVLTGAGRSFSAGADLSWMKRMAGYSFEQNLADARGLARLLKTLDRLAKPTIARVNGPAYGGGVGLVAACDIAIAQAEAAFSLTEVKLGLIPAVISPYVVAAIGPRAARRYTLTAERFDAEEASKLGLVHEVAKAEGLDGAVKRVVDILLTNGPWAMAAGKSLIGAVANRPIDDAVIEDTAFRIAECRASPEGKEGVGAFLEKRKPSWMT